MSDTLGSGDEPRRALLDTDERRLAVLLDQFQRLMTERDPDTLLRRVASAAREITEARIAAVGIVTDEGRFEDLVSAGLDDELAAESIEQPFLFVPIASPSRVYGWLVVADKIGVAEFSDVDRQLATTFGAQAGIVYENARLMSRLTAQAEALREQDELTDFAMTAAGIGVSCREIGSTTVAMSKSLASLLGFPEDVRTVSQDELYERAHPEDRARMRATVEEAVRDRSDFTLAFRMVLPDGAMRWFQFDGRVALDAAREPARVVGVLSDITNRRSLELQLRQAQKMEAIGQLAGGVAHDFNNLLTAIMGYARFALERAGEGEQRRDLEEIVKAAGRAAALTKQLLSFSRRHVMETVSIDLNLLIVDMVAMLRRMISVNIELTTSLGPGLSAVRADRSQLVQVLMNLVLNARDATADGGAILIETSAEAIGTPPPHLELGPGLYVTLSVTDNGCGMSDETRSRLFEPFFTTKPRGQGTGLGLATVYGIVMQTGGAIDVKSEPGKGSSFIVYLPTEKSPAPAVEPPAVSRRASGTATVLLVEDEQAVRELVRIILERAGYTLVEAANADEAETLFAAMGAADLLLTDVVMPGRSGFELFDRLHATLPSLRVLFISGYTDDAMFDATIVDGDLAFLEKPFSSDGLLAKVREVLGH